MLEGYKDKVKKLYNESKEEKILGPFLLEESSISQNRVKETSTSKNQVKRSRSSVMGNFNFIFFYSCGVSDRLERS